MAGLYLHIPFCKQACHYCNFHFTTSLRQKPELLLAMEKELIGRAPDWNQHPIETIYFGGGTPSLLTPAELERLLLTIQANYAVDTKAEITLEANPDDIQKNLLSDWKRLGINRLSLGIQSFADTDLVWMNRAHQAKQSLEALPIALKHFPNLTADLIYGTPGLTDEQWLKNINTLIQLGVPHISAYALTVEPKTPLEKQIRLQQKSTTNPDQQARQFLIGIDALCHAGYEHYEISNFAKPGHRSKHNSSYWKGVAYLGVGPSAHSFQPPMRSWQVANNRQYIEQMELNQWIYEKEILTPVQELNERIMIALRTTEGLDLSNIAFGILKKWDTLIKRYLELDWIILQDQRIKLTNKGKLHADGIAAALFLEETDQIN